MRSTSRSYEKEGGPVVTQPVSRNRDRIAGKENGIILLNECSITGSLFGKSIFTGEFEPGI
jgi:hypothetical protein